MPVQSVLEQAQESKSLDKYYEIQKIFSDIYISELKSDLEQYNNQNQNHKVVIGIYSLLIVSLSLLICGILYFRYVFAQYFAENTILYIIGFLAFCIIILICVIAYKIYDYYSTLEYYKYSIFSEAKKRLKPFMDLDYCKPGRENKLNTFVHLL